MGLWLLFVRRPKDSDFAYAKDSDRRKREEAEAQRVAGSGTAGKPAPAAEAEEEEEGRDRRAIDGTTAAGQRPSADDTANPDSYRRHHENPHHTCSPPTARRGAHRAGPAPVAQSR